MDGKAPQKSVLYKSGADLRESQQSSDSQGWVIVDCTDSDKKTPVWVAKKSPQHASKDTHDPTPTTDSNYLLRNQKLDLQQVGAWAYAQTNYRTNTKKKSCTGKYFENYPLKRYQEQPPEEDPWSMVFCEK